MSENCNHDCASCGTTCGERTAPQSLLAPNNPSSNIKKVALSQQMVDFDEK